MSVRTDGGTLAIATNDGGTIMAQIAATGVTISAVAETRAGAARRGTACGTMVGVSMTVPTTCMTATPPTLATPTLTGAPTVATIGPATAITGTDMMGMTNRRTTASR